MNTLKNGRLYKKRRRHKKMIHKNRTHKNKFPPTTKQDYYNYFKNKELEFKPEFKIMHMKSKIKTKYSKESLVDFIFNYFQETIADEDDKNELTSSNFVFWITNNLIGMVRNYKDDRWEKVINKFIEGPCYNKTGDEITKKMVEKQHKYVRKLLMNLSNKNLFALVGYSIYFK